MVALTGNFGETSDIVKCFSRFEVGLNFWSPRLGRVSSRCRRVIDSGFDSLSRTDSRSLF